MNHKLHWYLHHLFSRNSLMITTVRIGNITGNKKINMKNRGIFYNKPTCLLVNNFRNKLILLINIQNLLKMAKIMTSSNRKFLRILQFRKDKTYSVGRDQAENQIQSKAPNRSGQTWVEMVVLAMHTDPLWQRSLNISLLFSKISMIRIVVNQTLSPKYKGKVNKAQTLEKCQLECSRNKII